jgi:nitrate reductase gamma subunit
MARIDPEFKHEIVKYGAGNFKACYNCGQCTAVCNLTEESANFPRKFIRLGLLGLKDDIINSKDLWMCYGCGDCSETCPREADPAAYMAALRRYAIARYDFTGLTRWLFTSNPFAILLTLFLAVLLGFFLLTIKPESDISRWIFQTISYEVIHDLGVIIFIIAGITALAGIGRMLLRLNKVSNESNHGKKQPVLQSVTRLITEFGTMHRHQVCDREEDSVWNNKPGYLKPWFVHYSIMWGFIGLLIATTLDFLFKDPVTTTWWPSRILGTISGLFLMYGATLSIFYRIKKASRFYAQTRMADWMFLIFLWIGGFTGFWLEVAVYTGGNHLLNHIVFLIHTIISMELVILFAFSKFVHAVYRPLALYFQYYRYGSIV